MEPEDIKVGGKYITTDTLYNISAGETVTVANIDKNTDSIIFSESPGRWSLQMRAENMLPVEDFKTGDTIEVRNHSSHTWEKRTYLFTLDEEIFCMEKDYYGESPYQTYSWKFSRPLQPHTITLDGKEVVLSEEAYQALKDSIS